MHPQLPINALIVDDEDLAREKIRYFLSEAAEWRVMADCANGFRAVEAVCEAVPEAVPDVIFLDIQMPELDGFETLRMIRDSLDEQALMPFVVFITAYDQYALKAFEAHAADYLLKPFDHERFHAMLARVSDHVRNRQAQRAYETVHEALLKEIAALKNPDKPRYTERFAFKTRGRIYFVSAENVDWIEADRNYALFHVGSLTHILRSTFGDLAEQLDPAQFLRVHRSAIVRKNLIKEIAKRSDRSYEVVLQGGQTLDIGIAYRESVFAALGLLPPPEDE